MFAVRVERIAHMVKGITRQVILVKSPDPKLFEEAIFIVKEEAFAREGIDAQQVIKQARQAANGYLKENRQYMRTIKQIPPAVWTLVGAAIASVAWAAWLFLI